MYCPSCGKEIPNDAEFCPECGANTNETQAQPVTTPDADAAYKAAAKKYWYSYLIPILFILPLSNKAENPEGNIALANNVLWILILNVALTIIGRLDIPVVSVIVGLLPLALSIFAIVAAVKAYKGEAIKVPVLGDVKILK